MHRSYIPSLLHFVSQYWLASSRPLCDEVHAMRDQSAMVKFIFHEPARGPAMQGCILDKRGSVSILQIDCREFFLIL